MCQGDSRHHKNTYINQESLRTSHGPISFRVTAQNSTHGMGNLRKGVVKKLFTRVWAGCPETTRNSNGILELKMGQGGNTPEPKSNVAIQTWSQRSPLTGPVTSGQDTQLAHSDPSGREYEE